MVHLIVVLNLHILTKTLCPVSIQPPALCPIDCSRLHFIHVRESDIRAPFGMLLENEEYSDVTFSMSGKRFHAHQLVLAGHSHVFETGLFLYGMDGNNSEIVIVDMEPKGFMALLHYIYRDTHDKDEDFLALTLSCTQSLSKNFSTKLLATSEEYALVYVLELASGRLKLNKSFEKKPRESNVATSSEKKIVDVREDILNGCLSSLSRNRGNKQFYSEDVTSLEYDRGGGFHLAIESSTGKVLSYALRSSYPIQVKHHRYGGSILDIKWHCTLNSEQPKLFTIDNQVVRI